MEAATAAVRRPLWLTGLIPVVVLAGAIGLFVALDAPGLSRIGVPEEKLAIERTVLRAGEIELHVRNDGADPVQVRQAIVNDGFASFTQSKEEIGRLGGAEVKIQYPWIEGENYEVALLTSTGATIGHDIEAAVETPDADLGFYGLMALIGLYVGVIPVAIGMLWLPWLRSVDARWIRFLLAFTVGLLGFLAIEALLEGTELAAEGPAVFGGAALVWLGAVGAYLALAGVDAWLRGRVRRSGEGEAAPAADGGAAGDGAVSSRRLGERAAFLVALGIGLHNLGEGL
ncbi:MAG TPA: ZIP family metal transporter, partial [Methylomirabilota bacterium]|nr:ZIP family metal transporter [Methylomirabilota bacterium]